MEQFLKDIANHEMTIISDRGVNRHIKFKNPKSSTYWFELVTWEGSLAINSDMGTYVFSRIKDMFDFFDRYDLVGYYTEKLRCWGISPRDLVMEFSQEAVNDFVRQLLERKCEDVPIDLFKLIKDDIQCDSAKEAYDLLHGFSCNNHIDVSISSDDLLETDFMDYKRSYLACIWAIVWGIQKYKAFQRNIDDDV